MHPRKTIYENRHRLLKQHQALVGAPLLAPGKQLSLSEVSSSLPMLVWNAGFILVEDCDGTFQLNKLECGAASGR